MKFYDSDQITIIIAGILINKGYADGEFLSVVNNSDAFTTVTGTDGEKTRSKSNDNGAIVTLKLMQTAEANAALSVLHNLDKLTSGGAGVGPLLILDRSGTTLFEAESCWIVKRPDASFDRTAKEREWKIEVADLVAFDGGN